LTLRKPNPNASLKTLMRNALKRDRRAIAQLISIAENSPRLRFKILSGLYRRTGKAYVVGITGPPGAGKSTLITELTKRYRQDGYSVGIVAIDPTSQVSGGALLGDRIRMGELASDPGVFIRSMATRGRVGGIAHATEDVVRILDASSMDYIIVETVGAGQSDVDIKNLAHTTIVVTAPGLGDEIQALKAGIMEIGDIFVVNKADMENADLSLQEMQSIIMMSEPIDDWRPKVMKTSALSGEGIPALVEAIRQHEKHVRDSSDQEALSNLRLRREVIDAAKRYFDDVMLQEASSTQHFKELLDQVQAGKLNPYTAAQRLVRLASRPKTK
jgi:LAO/AO transport system kinase